MARFNDVLDKFSDAELPEEFLSALMTAYDEDMSIPNAKVAQVEADRDSYIAKVNELKVQNYDLIRTGVGNGGTDTNGETGEAPDSADDIEPITIDDLFDN